jgi:hypothetical protein
MDPIYGINDRSSLTLQHSPSKKFLVNASRDGANRCSDEPFDEPRDLPARPAAN